MSEKLQLTLGCQLIALYLDAPIFGAAVLMVLQYFRTFNDSRKLKILVAALGIVATINMIAFYDFAYMQYILEVGNAKELDRIPVGGYIKLLCTYTIAFLAQCFFLERIYIVSRKNMWICIPIALLILLAFASGIALCAQVTQLGLYSLLGVTQPVHIVQTVSTAACDVLITASLCYVLRKRRTGVKATDRLVDSLIVFAINRGAITSVCAIMNTVWFVLRPSTLIFMIPFDPTAPLYVISVVATLIVRTGLREALDHADEGTPTVPLKTLMLASGTSSNTDKTESGPRLSTHIVSWDTKESSSINDVEAQTKSAPV